MANPGGGVGAKFVSVNLNKFYGQVSHHNHQPYGGSYGQSPVMGRGRPGSGSGGSGGMVVLSRSRSSQKAAGSKLSVPPPLNLPSMRKEHEKFDLSGSVSGPAIGAATGSGPRPSSSGMGWTKPVAISLQEKDATEGDTQVESSGHGVDGKSRLTSVYMPPSARPSGVGIATSGAGSARPLPKPVEKAVVLKGEDFPSLQAALPVPSGLGPKQKDSVSHKQKPAISESSTDQQQGGLLSNSCVDIFPHGHGSDSSGGNGTIENIGDSRVLGSSHMANQHQKEDYFSGPLPLVRLNPRSDWADDERDTGHGIVERNRDAGFSKTESYWERNFDMPRTSILPHKTQFERWGLRDDEAGRNISSNVSKGDPYYQEVRTPSREGREGNMWQSSPIPKDALNAQEVTNDRTSMGPRPSNKHFGNDNKYIKPHVGESAQDVVVLASQETTYERRNTGLFLEGRPQWNITKESYNSQGVERNSRERYGTEQTFRYRVDSLQNNSSPKSLFALGGKMPSASDPVIASGRDKRGSAKTERQYFEDSFVGTSGFDDKDLFTGLVGVIKRKKDLVKQSDLHDPVRESFEAELERVQKMQELERQWIIEEQDRALEHARREEKERQKLLREEEERQQRREEEEREAARRAEQERLEALQRAEEQKVAREEEKKIILIEEERRKQAAKQKLIELEERMAKRQVEAVKSDYSVVKTQEKLPEILKDKDVTTTDLETWEDGEKMVERITASASFDPAVLNRPFEINSRSYATRESTSGFLDRGKPYNSCRRDAFDSSGNNASSQIREHEISHFGPLRDSFPNVRAVGRKDFHGGAGYMSSRSNFRGMQEPYLDEFGHQRDNRWNFSGDAESFSRGRNTDSEFQDNLAERYGDVGWAQNHFHENSPYPGRPYPNSESDELYSYGRSRYLMRQPRVLPPPIASRQRNSFRVANEHPGPSGFLVNNDNFTHTETSESTRPSGYYSSQQDGLEQSELVDMLRESATVEDKKLNKDMTPRCDSQSSVSVSSPPSSPPHLSHDELDDSGDSPMLSPAAERKHLSLSGNEAVNTSGQHAVMASSGSISAIEDEEWTLENNDDLQQQEEYDEDEDGYQEEDEVREVDDENLDLNEEFGDLHLDEKGCTRLMDNLVLGFDEGIEVELSNDDFDRNYGNEERSFGISDSSIHIAREQSLGDGVHGDEQSSELVDGFPPVSTMVQGTENALQDTVAKPIDDPYISITSDGSVLSAQQALPPSVGMPSSIGLTTRSTVSPVLNQVDTPVKLQFGLFSGPSLIPSPVPAIQIGSIQMPLHLHPPIGSSLAQMHPSQPPIFQFGQVRYPSPISQGMLPIAPTSMSIFQSNVQSSYGVNQNDGDSLPTQPSQDASSQNVVNNSASLAMNKKPGFVSGGSSDSQGCPSLVMSSDFARHSANSSSQTQITAKAFSGSDDKLKSELVGQAESRRHNDDLTRNCLPSRGTISGYELQPVNTSSESISNAKSIGGVKAQVAVIKGKRFTYAVKNSSQRPALSVSENSSLETNGFQRRSRRTIQRTEFRVRENVERATIGSFSSSSLNAEDKYNYNGRSSTNFARSGSKRLTMSSKPAKQMADSEGSSSGNMISQDVEYENLRGKEIEKSVPNSDHSLSQFGEGNAKRNISEEDIDAPLKSGVVRVFKQSGIETPSDEDDFIEVRSKRQMLNDRREQREKEIKAKAQPPRKPRATRQITGVSTNSKRVSGLLGRELSPNINSDFASYKGRGLSYKETSTPSVSQPLAPIGTPAVKFEIQAVKRSQNIKPLSTSSVPVVSGDEKYHGPPVMFEGKNKVLDNVSSSLNSWDNVQFSQQTDRTPLANAEWGWLFRSLGHVMALTQTQLEEAMKVPCFDSSIASVGGHSSSVAEPLLPSLLIKERSFSTSSSPINSLLAGEKIQFGAITSPPIFPPSSRTPGFTRPEMQIPHNLSGAEDDCNLLFKKDKQTDDSCVRLQDSEAEAEAAASAVAVAAIASDDVVESGLSSITISRSKSFGGADIDGISTGMASDQQLVSQSRAEESLSVSLPADLSVETPPIFVWPPLPSLQNSSNHMLSHIPGGRPPSHFPFYEMNPLLGGPIFTFGPSEESVGTQSQTQKSGSTSSSGPLGTWQQCHSTVDSFYGPPAGYTGPFISPSGGIPGVQGPPHMVVYNNFAPVGQFGQVGLSFMGPTYIPSGKHSDWKHNSSSSAVGMGEGHMNNSNIAAGQRNPPNVVTPIQHLASGSSMMPIASPLAMFDVSPFQSAPDISVQAHWSHVPAPPLHTVSLSRPLHQAEGILPSQLGHVPVDQALNVNRFCESRTSTPCTSGPSFSVASEVNAVQFPDELCLVDASRWNTAVAPNQSTVSHSTSSSSTSDASNTGNLLTGVSNNNEGHITSGFKTQSSQQKNLAAPLTHPSNYNQQRKGSGSSQRNSSGNEWSRRRTGFHGRNQSFGFEKGISSSKMKQIYVAKQPTSGTSAAG